MCVLSFDDGMLAESWYAEFALRRRVSMSAIGSVIVMSGGASLAAVPHALGPRRLGAWACRRSVVLGLMNYQLDLRTPGSSPACAISRRQIRHRPNLRKTECGRPHRWQRVYPRTLNFGLRFAFSIRAFLAIVCLLPAQRMVATTG